MKIKPGDRIHYKKPGDAGTYRRTVRSLAGKYAVVFFKKKDIFVGFEYILRIEKTRKKAPGGRNKLAAAMFKKGIRNEDLAARSGYSVGTVDRARRGKRVLPLTLSTLIETAGVL